ncbi:MAG TPA: LodA/GoxA family CTQ-dependent oxidase, partial [Thermoanaerobaculia bacterium]
MSEIDSIVRCVIYPGVGIARVGNAPEEYFLGPQVPGEVPAPPYKDAEGRMKRQGALFRVYGLNAAGDIVREITAADGAVEWRVHLANRKAAWYQFNNAMDLGEYALAAQRRNGSVADRSSLVIDPGSRTISGRGTHGPQYRFDSGTFGGKPVPLGELRTDDAGRLVVLGGLGSAAPGSDVYNPVTTFANNDGWHDDVSDGPVRATVRLGDRTLEAEPSVVIVGPPNYGQGLYGVVTMYDVLIDLYSREGWVKLPERPSFGRDIYPIFARLSTTQWVNQGFFVLFGESSPSDFTAPEVVAKLADPSPAAEPYRRGLFHWFRDATKPRNAPQEPVRLPPFYGDGFGDFSGVLIDDLTVTPTQYAWLARWADGDFDADLAAPAAKPAALAEVPPGEQPSALDRAAFEDCLGGPFHPGIEMTWIVRVPRIWKGPFRLNVLPEGENPTDDYGPILHPEVALGAGGPLAACGAGSITRWMAVPWQTDASSCLSGYAPSTYLPLPTFWAARVPNQVLPERAYERLMDRDLPVGQRLKHFDNRQFWLRDLGSAYQTRINDMITEWSLLGIVEERPGPDDAAAAHLPSRLWVETGRNAEFMDHDPTWEQVKLAERPADRHAARAVEQAAVALAAESPSVRRRR